MINDKIKIVVIVYIFNVFGIINDVKIIVEIVY